MLLTKRLNLKEILLMFWAFFKIGAFTLGGGFAMIPLMKVEMVDKQKWIGEEEFLDVIAITQSVPGAVAINASMSIGYRVAGLLGAVIATLGTILPSFIIILCIALFYSGMKSNKIVKKVFKGIYPTIVVLILSAALNLKKAAVKDVKSMFIVVVSIIALLVFKIHPIIVIIVSGILGMIFSQSQRIRGGKN